MAKVFFSYSHRDEALRDELEKHLSILMRQGFIETWHDRRIGAGAEFEYEISETLETADVILLLVQLRLFGFGLLLRHRDEPGHGAARSRRGARHPRDSAAL